MASSDGLVALLEAVRVRVEPLGVFGSVEMRDRMLVASAKASADEAFYRLEAGRAGEAPVWVSVVTPSRWLSESIESDLVEHGDDLGELIEDELIELGYEGAGMPPTFQHFRSADLLYTFRTPLPIEAGSIGNAESAATATVWLRAYEQAFRRLGDMGEGE